MGKIRGFTKISKKWKIPLLIFSHILSSSFGGIITYQFAIRADKKQVHFDKTLSKDIEYKEKLKGMSLRISTLLAEIEASQEDIDEIKRILDIMQSPRNETDTYDQQYLEALKEHGN